MRDLDIKTLRFFVAVCDLGNIKLAAEQENIEPSAISKRLAILEDNLGVPVLVRNRAGATLTPAGHALIEHARNLLFTMDRIDSDINAFKGGIKGHVRLVASASALAESLLDDVSAFMQAPENRGIKVDMEELLSVDLIRAVSNGSASIGVCWDTAEFGDLIQVPYRSDQLALAVPQNHSLASKAAIKFSDSLDFEHVGLSPNTAVYRLLRKAAAQNGKFISYRAVVSNFDAAFRVVAANLGVSVVPIEVGETYKTLFNVKLIPLTDKWALRNFAICFRDHSSLKPAESRLIDFLLRKNQVQAKKICMVKI